MAKQDEHRFNLRFDEDDENHRRVSALFEPMRQKKGKIHCKGGTCLLGTARWKDTGRRTAGKETVIRNRVSDS